MRILFFSHYFPPEGNAPASRTYENARHWVDAGHEVTVITCAPNVPAGVVYNGYKNALLSREMIDGIQVMRVWTYIVPNKGTVRRIINYLSYMVSASIFSLFTQSPDIVIATSPQFFCGWAGINASFIMRVPFILEIRDIWPESIVAVGAMKKSTLIRLLEWLELKMYAAASHIVTVGEGYSRRLLAKGVKQEKLSVIMNGVDPEGFTPRAGDTALKQKWGIENKFVCIYAGTIGMACGLHIVLDAALKLKYRGIDDIVFMMVGDGAAREELEKQAAIMKLQNVVFSGRQPKHMMPEYLAISDVSLVHLRKTDLFTSVMPSKMFETAAMEIPIINGVSGFAAQFIEQAHAGMNIEPENSDELIEALLKFKQDKTLRREYGLSGRKYVVMNFDRNKLAGEYLNVIEDVLKNKRTGDHS